jgi:stage II sporulation protein D
MTPCNASRKRLARSSSWLLAGLLGLAGCAPAVPPAAVVTPVGAEPMVRVGLVVDTAQVELGATTSFEITDPASGRTLHRGPASEPATILADSRGQLVVRVGQREIPSGGTTLTARADVGGLMLIGERQYRGTALLRATGPGRVTAINQVDMENYLLGVVPYEIGRVGPELLEASKAQAVAARTYAFRYMGRREALGFDVFATVQDQVYGGAAGEHEPVSVAVRETAGEILTYAGEPVEAFYHSTCAGQTAAIEEVWFGERPRPYLVSVVDVNPATGEPFDITSNRFRWTERWTHEQLREIFNRTLADSLPAGVRDVGEIRNFEVLRRTPSGRIGMMRITTSNATFDVGGDRIRWIFLRPEGPILNSSKFDVRIERDAQGRPTEIVAEGGGWGHGIGMCQVGAMGRARAGQDYRTILRTYYPGTEIVRLY